MIERSKRRLTPTTSPVTCSTGSAKHVLTSPACRRNEALHQRGHPAIQRRTLRLKEGRDEERMVLELHRPHFPAVIPPGGAQPARLEPLGVARIEAVIAVIAFDGVISAIDFGQARASGEADPSLLLNERTGERSDHRISCVRVEFGMGRVRRVQPPDSPGILQDRVLEAGAGAEERAAALPGDADRP